jgi:hypothetical protein
MASNKAKSDLYKALQKYGADDKNLIFDLYQGLKKLFAEPYILDSKKGAKLGKTWLIKCQDTETNAEDLTFSSSADAKKLAHWVNTQWTHLPQTVEEQFVYWTSVNKEQKVLSNFATFMTGAVLRRRSGSFINKSEVINNLLREMTKLDPKTTRAKAIKLVNGIAKYYSLVCVCGLDVLFCQQLSLRSLREKTAETFDTLAKRVGEVGDDIAKAFLDVLTGDSVIKKLLDGAIDDMHQHLAADKIGGKRSGVAIKNSSPKKNGKITKTQKPKDVGVAESLSVLTTENKNEQFAKENQEQNVAAGKNIKASDDTVATSEDQVAATTKQVIAYKVQDEVTVEQDATTIEVEGVQAEPLKEVTASEKDTHPDYVFTA